MTTTSSIIGLGITTKNTMTKAVVLGASHQRSLLSAYFLFSTQIIY